MTIANRHGIPAALNDGISPMPSPTGCPCQNHLTPTYQEDESMTTYLLMAALWGGMAWLAGSVIDKSR
jgi:hypothetical protein